MTIANAANEDWKLLLSFFPPNWKELGQVTEALKGLRQDKRASCKIASSGIRFGRGVDFTRFEGQEIAAPAIGGRGKDNACCFWARRDCAD